MMRPNGLGWGLAVTLTAAGTLLAFAAHQAGPLPGDSAITRALQGRPPDGAVGLSLTYIGDAVWFLPVVALAVAMLLRRWSAAVFILLAGATGLLVGYVSKPLVARPRPPAEVARVAAEGYGFPSSTTLFVVVLLGAACYLLRGAPRPIFAGALIISCLMAGAVGLSRVYVGEHWATDVLGAWIFGLVWLLVLISAHRRWFDGRAKAREGGEP